jgi:hypothetical protein
MPVRAAELGLVREVELCHDTQYRPVSSRMRAVRGHGRRVALVDDRQEAQRRAEPSRASLQPHGRISLNAIGASGPLEAQREQPRPIGLSSLTTAASHACATAKLARLRVACSCAGPSTKGTGTSGRDPPQTSRCCPWARMIAIFAALAQRRGSDLGALHATRAATSVCWLPARRIPTCLVSSAGREPAPDPGGASLAVRRRQGLMVGSALSGVPVATRDPTHRMRTDESTCGSRVSMASRRRLACQRRSLGRSPRAPPTRWWT